MHFPAFKVARATCRGCALGGAGRKDQPLGSSSPGKKETKSAVVTPAEPLASTEHCAVKLSGTENQFNLYKEKKNFSTFCHVKLFEDFLKTVAAYLRTFSFHR